MPISHSCFALVLAVTVTGPAIPKQESGSFVVRLGNDTTSVEHYTRTANRVEIDQVGRAPRVMHRHFTYDFDKAGAISSMNMVVTPPGATVPTQTIDAKLQGDSLLMEVKNGAAVQNPHVAFPAGTVVITNSSPWAMYEGQTMKLAKLKADTLRTPMYYLGGPTMSWMVVRKLGRDSMVIQTENNFYHAKVDRAGHILGTRPIDGTGRFTIDRVTDLDLAGMMASFSASEKQAGAMGALSPRDTVRVDNAGGAALMIDYSRPSKRGRAIFGNVVPYGELWRTGANAATQFRTDKALEIGGVTVPAGFYTLWTLPSPNGWKLIVNSETGQWGTEHKADKDLITVDMATTTLAPAAERFTISVVPSPTGGVLNFDWDATRASVPFTVKQ